MIIRNLRNFFFISLPCQINGFVVYIVSGKIWYYHLALYFFLNKIVFQYRSLSNSLLLVMSNKSPPPALNLFLPPPASFFSESEQVLQNLQSSQKLHLLHFLQGSNSSVKRSHSLHSLHWLHFSHKAHLLHLNDSGLTKAGSWVVEVSGVETMAFVSLRERLPWK